MQVKVKFIRIMAIPVCLAWGILELIALQRSRWVGHR